MMFCQKAEIGHLLGKHKRARDHLVSTELTQGKNVVKGPLTYFLGCVAKDVMVK